MDTEINNTNITNVTRRENKVCTNIHKLTSFTDINSGKINRVWTKAHLKGLLSLWQRLVLRINGCVFLHYEKREGWKGYLPIYLVHCKEHGYFLDYPQGLL